MKTITARYPGTCKQCDEIILRGEQAVYERRAGVWHPSCAPEQLEDVRAARAESRNSQADELEKRAIRKRTEAEELEKQNEPYRRDHAFMTQPGSFPARTRFHQRARKAAELFELARLLEVKAKRLRASPQVAGDAEVTRERKRSSVRSWIKKGMLVRSIIYGVHRVLRVNKNTATLDCGVGPIREDLSFIHRIEEEGVRA